MAKDYVRKCRILIIGGSAGSLDIVLRIINDLRNEKDIAIIIIVHRKNTSDSILTDLIRTKTALAVKEIEDKESIVMGTIYIAPPDYHLLLEDEYTFSLDSSEKIHFSRPSIDVAFESAAEVFGPSLIGVLLSGANADGAEGLKTIAGKGGYTIVQKPSSAEVDYMPQQAINLYKSHTIVNGEEIGTLIKKLREG